VQKLNDKDVELLDIVNVVHLANKSAYLLTASKLKIMVQWYKQEGDAAMPSKKGELLARYEETLNHDNHVLTPPMATPAPAHAEDDDDDLM